MTLNEALLTPKETISPFLPGTNIQFAWDSTSLGLLKTCPRLYQYIMIDGWGDGEESIHLRFGQEYHTALQDYELFRADGQDHEEALFQTVRMVLIATWDVDTEKPWTPQGKATKWKNRASLLRTVIDYLDTHQNDPAKTYILESGKPAVELSFRFELDWGPKGAIRDIAVESLVKVAPNLDAKFYEHHYETQPYLLSGHLDRVVSFQDQLFVMDHKTTTSTPGDYYFDQYAPNNQMTLYTLASRVILDSPVKGVIINAAQLLVDSSRFVRGLTYRTSDQLQEWVADLHSWFALAEGYATANYWPMNDTACDKFGGCRFRHICSKSPGVREQFLKSSFTKLAPEDRWNPLRSR